MTTNPSAEAQGSRVGPPPPFDPELAAALEIIREQLPSSFSVEMIPALREGIALSEGADLDLTRDGAFEVEERTVPGPQGAPDISCSSAGRPGPPRPCPSSTTCTAAAW